MRGLILAASREPHVQSFLTHGPGRALAERFIAGERLDDALAAVDRLGKLGYRISLDYLGESVTDLAEARAAAGTYHQTIERLKDHVAPVSLSIKPTQFGADLDPTVSLALLGDVTAHAAAYGHGVRLDMEDSHHTDVTLWLWRELRSRGRDVGGVLQAALYRTPGDLDTILAGGGSVRLCKGAYLEPSTVAYPRKADVDRAYARLLDKLLREVAGPTRARPGLLPRAAIATHDEHLIEHAVGLVRGLSVDPSQYEFQMLYGVRRDLQERLLRHGFPVRIYVPWGPAWYAYLTRRLAERPANLTFFLTSLFAEASGRHAIPPTIGSPTSLRR